MLATPETLMEASQQHRLAKALPAWLREVPLYLGSNGDVPETIAPDHFRRLPFITKADIRRNFPRNFLRPGVELEDLVEREIVELEHTSGTSEERTPLILGQGWWAEQELRALRLNPFVARLLEETPAARRVTISSPVCSSDICYTGVPARSERVVGNSLFLSLSRLPFLWSEHELARMATEALEWAPLFLDVDPVYGVVFALYCERKGIRLPSLRFIICSYEFVSAAHRRIFERVFGVPVFDLYGSTETGHLLMEVEPGGAMRASLETAFLEVVNADANGVGDLVVTTLTNEFMPLVRYRIGDLVQREQRAYCTRYVVHGRGADAFRRPGGGRVTILQVDRCLAGVEGVAHYQLCEQPGNRFSFRFVADASSQAGLRSEEVARRLEGVLGDGATISVERVDFLMPESSGKFRLCYPLA